MGGIQLYLPYVDHSVGWKSGHRLLLIPNFVFTPIPGDENESNTPINIEIYHRHAVDSVYVYHLFMPSGAGTR